VLEEIPLFRLTWLGWKKPLKLLKGRGGRAGWNRYLIWRGGKINHGRKFYGKQKNRREYSNSTRILVGGSRAGNIIPRRPSCIPQKLADLHNRERRTGLFQTG